MSKVCKHCDLAWNDRSPAMFCLSCGRPLISVENHPGDYAPVNKKHAITSAIWLILLDVCVLISVWRNYGPGVECGYETYYKKTISGSFVLVGSKGFGRASDRYGRIDVSKADGTTYFVIDDDGEKYSAELTFRKTQDDRRIAHIVYSDGMEYEGYYYKGDTEDITPHPEDRLITPLCQIARSDWDYRESLLPAFYGGWFYMVGFLFFAIPDFAHAAASKSRTLRKLKEKERRNLRVFGIVVMIMAMALMMIVSDKALHGVHYFHI